MDTVTTNAWVPSPSWARQVCNRIRLIDDGTRSAAPVRLTAVINSDDTTVAVIEEIGAITVCIAQGVIKNQERAIAALDEESLAILCLLEDLRNAVLDDDLDVALPHVFALTGLTLKPSSSVWTKALSERILLLVTQFAFPCAMGTITELRKRVAS